MTREEELNLEEKDLYEKLNKIKKQKEKIRQQKISDKRKEIDKKIEYLQEHKDIILPLFKHEMTSCSDEHPCNGYCYSIESARCKKCYLIEILNGVWRSEINIKFDIDFYDVKNLV